MFCHACAEQRGDAELCSNCGAAKQVIPKKEKTKESVKKKK